MSNAKILESEFEANICDVLAASGWIYSGGTAPDPDWRPDLGVHVGDLLWWLANRYPKQFERAVPPSLVGTSRQQAEQQLIQRAHEVLAAKPLVDPMTGRERNGLLGLLRSGFDYMPKIQGALSAKFGPLCEFPPENPLLTSAQEWYEKNRLRVLRQVRFDPHKNSTIDLVLTVNGLPVATLELKTDNTQRAEDAVAQYRQDRNPTKRTPLLQPGHCLVHFVVSNTRVMMTTALKGAETRFIPFDKGNNGHAGNAPSKIGSPTDYLWREVLAPATLVRILNNFAMRDDGALVFPRYHQLRAVENVTGDVAGRGAGGRYLIWHSAGSGKTKTIAWLAHRLGRLHDNGGDKIFDSVIVVSDRRVLDDQLRRAVNMLGASKGYVIGIDERAGAKSRQLRDALTEGDHIITVTLQSFPEALKIIEDSAALRQRRWCIIADEAHSSQTGDAASGLRKLLAAYPDADPDPNDKEQGFTSDDFLLARGSAMATAANMTFIALTATPKHRTLRLFGTRDDEGNWRAFDTYTMAQAIEEGFILDVLKRYSTYSMFARIRDSINGEESEHHVDYKVDQSKAISSIVKFIRLHPTAIAQKVQIVIEHFRANVAGSLEGRAKAMVVTSSRDEAVRWSLAMNKYLADKGYHDMTALVAFSGEIDVDGEKYTEPGMTGISEKALPQYFRESDEARVLIVADKYQTGYDEPLLCAMYVDKQLSGIAAVQTLSRLNRTAPGKPLPIVLDFRNDAQTIQDSFATYYSDAYISQETDPNVLFNLADRLDLAGYYDEEQLYQVSDAYLSGVSGEQLRQLLQPVIHGWNERYAATEPESAEREEVLAFRRDARSYHNAWDFLSQIVDYGDPRLHRRAILAGLLERNLKVDFVFEQIEIDTVELVGLAIAADTKDEQDHSITPSDATDLSASAYDGDRTLGGQTREQIALADAIDKVNEMFAASGLDLGDGSGAAWTRAAWGVLAEDDEIQAMSRENSDEQLKASPKFHDKVVQALVSVASDSTAMTEAVMANPDLKDKVVDLLATLAAVALSQAA